MYEKVVEKIFGIIELSKKLLIMLTMIYHGYLKKVKTKLLNMLSKIIPLIYRYLKTT
jgi:hypothetical protein